jgi:hypothetical protein
MLADLGRHATWSRQGPTGKDGARDSECVGLGPDEASRGPGRGPIEPRGLRGRRGWRTWVVMQRWSRQGPVRKDGARDSTAMEIRKAVGAPGFKLRWTEPRGPFGDSAGVASGQTPKKPEERTASRRESDQESKGAGGPGQWVTGARVRSWARNQCRRNGRRGDWRQGPLGSKVRGVGLGGRHMVRQSQLATRAEGRDRRNQTSGPAPIGTG